MATVDNIVIRRAKATDLNSLTALLRLLFSIEENFIYEETVQRRGLLLMLENKNGVVLVAESFSKVIGMCTAQLVISTAEGGPAILVEDVVVLPGWRAKGVGGQLLNSIEHWAKKKNASRLQLLADCNNRPALSFYSKQQYQPTKLICLRKKQL